MRFVSRLTLAFGLPNLYPGRIERLGFGAALSSVQGPAVARTAGKALALRVDGLEAASLVTQYWEMLLPRHVWEFALATSRLQMPIFNIIYADRDGQIMYLFGGQQPVRPGGTYQDWAGILPGNTSPTLWTETLSWGQLPKTIDPPGGYVSNANEPPWFATFSRTIQQNQYPSYIALAGDSRGRGAPRLEPQQRCDRHGALLFELWYQAYLADAGSPRSTSWGSDYPAFRANGRTPTR